MKITWKKANAKDIPTLEKFMLNNISNDQHPSNRDGAIEVNDRIMEWLEDSFGVDLTRYYGEADPREIKNAIKELEKI